MDIVKIAALGLTMTSVLALSRPSFAEAPLPQDPSQDRPAATQIQADEIVFHGDTAKRAPKHLLVKAEADKDHRVIMHVSDADAPPAPSAPPAPPASALPPQPPAPPAPLHVRSFVHVEFNKAEKEAMRQAATAEAQRAMAEARKTIAEAHIDQVVTKAMREAMRDMQTALGKAKLSQAETEKAIADAHIDRVVNEAMRKAEQSLARARIEWKTGNDDGPDDEDQPAPPDAPDHQ